MFCRELFRDIPASESEDGGIVVDSRPEFFGRNEKKVALL